MVGGVLEGEREKGEGGAGEEGRGGCWWSYTESDCCFDQWQCECECECELVRSVTHA